MFAELLESTLFSTLRTQTDSMSALICTDVRVLKCKPCLDICWLLNHVLSAKLISIKLGILID